MTMKDDSPAMVAEEIRLDAEQVRGLLVRMSMSDPDRPMFRGLIESLDSTADWLDRVERRVWRKLIGDGE